MFEIRQKLNDPEFDQQRIPLAGISAGFEEMRNSGDIHHPADMKVAQDYFDKWYKKTIQ